MTPATRTYAPAAASASSWWTKTGNDSCRPSIAASQRLAVDDVSPFRVGGQRPRRSRQLTPPGGPNMTSRWFAGILLTLLLLAAPAEASRPATSTERRAIVAVIHHSGYLGPRSDWHCWRIRARISTVSPRWAAADVIPHGCREQRDRMSLIHSYGRWHVHDPHGGGCSPAPPAVKRDLHLTCP